MLKRTIKDTLLKIASEDFVIKGLESLTEDYIFNIAIQTIPTNHLAIFSDYYQTGSTKTYIAKKYNLSDYVVNKIIRHATFMLYYKIFNHYAAIELTSVINDFISDTPKRRSIYEELFHAPGIYNRDWINGLSELEVRREIVEYFWRHMDDTYDYYEDTVFISYFSCDKTDVVNPHKHFANRLYKDFYDYKIKLMKNMSKPINDERDITMIRYLRSILGYDNEHICTGLQA